jgi:hypothetical protein
MVLMMMVTIVNPSGAAANKSLNPTAPVRVHAVAGDGLATISWLKPTSRGGSGIVKYLVTAHPSNKTCYTPTSPCVLSGLTNKTTYRFTVTAENKTGVGKNSTPSNRVTPQALPASSDVTTINDVSFNGPDGIASNGSSVWVANYQGGPNGTGSVSQINVATGSVTEIDDASFVSPAAITIAGGDVWVANLNGGSNNTGSVSEINVATGVVTQINDPSFDGPDAMTADGTDVWVANAGNGSTDSGSVSEINIATGVVTQISNPSINDPDAIASNGTVVAVANQFGGTVSCKCSGSISEINIASGKVTDVMSPFIHLPTGVALDQNTIWVTGNGEGLAISGSDSLIFPILAKINISSGAVSKVNGPLSGNGVSVTLDGSNLWVNNYQYVYELNAFTGKVLLCDTASLNTPYGISLDGTYLWVVNNAGGASGTGSITRIGEASTS